MKCHCWHKHWPEAWGGTGKSEQCYMCRGTENPPFREVRHLGLTGPCHHSPALEGVAPCFKREDREEREDVDTPEGVHEVGTREDRGQQRKVEAAGAVAQQVSCLLRCAQRYPTLPSHLSLGKGGKGENQNRAGENDRLRVCSQSLSFLCNAVK